jgi:hypothetical protein
MPSTTRHQATAGARSRAGTQRPMPAKSKDHGEVLCRSVASDSARWRDRPCAPKPWRRRAGCSRSRLAATLSMLAPRSVWKAGSKLATFHVGSLSLPAAREIQRQRLAGRTESTITSIGHGRYSPIPTTASDNTNPTMASRRCASISGQARCHNRRLEIGSVIRSVSQALGVDSSAAFARLHTSTT